MCVCVHACRLYLLPGISENEVYVKTDRGSATLRGRRESEQRERKRERAQVIQVPGVYVHVQGLMNRGRYYTQVCLVHKGVYGEC